MREDFRVSFGEEIRRLRKSHDLSQVELAALVGVTQGAITNIETGRMSTVSVETLYRFCDVLKVSADHFRPFLATQPEPPAPERPMGKRK